MPLGPGSRLDAYEIVRPLGSGGMGEVWLATEVRLGRKVALKVLPADLTRDPSRVQRFEQEARAASALNHPNVCTIHALGETSDGQHYIAMEYVEGETLRQRLSTITALDPRGARHRDPGRGGAERRARRWHRPPRHQARERDAAARRLRQGAGLRPGEARARRRRAGSRTPRSTVLKTDAGMVVGTAAYMSPEQARGQEVDARTDIWSLGVLLYEMVAGRSPFAAPSGTDVLAAILDRDPRRWRASSRTRPPELQRILTKALRKDRAQRYQTVQDLLLDLQALRDEIQSRHTPGPALPPQQPLTRVKRRKSAFILGSLLLLVGIAAGVWWVASKRRGTTELPQREPVLTQLTANPMELPVSSVAISPDGRYLAYADPSGIKVRHIDTGETQSIPDTRRMNVYAWTGDSTKVRATACDATLCVGWDISLVGWARHRSGANWPATQFVVAAPVGSRFLRFTDSGLEINLLNDTPPLVIKTAALWLAAWSADGRRGTVLKGRLFSAKYCD